MGKWLLIVTLGCLGSLLQAGEPDPGEHLGPAGQTAPDEDIQRPALRSRHQLALQRLQHSYPEQFRALNSQYDAAAALYLPANHSEARGWVILLPGTGQTADAAFNIERLRQTLPDAGWHTLSLQLPAPAFAGLHVSPAPPPPENSQPADGDNRSDVSSEPSPAGITEPADSPARHPDATLNDGPAAATAQPATPGYAERMLALLDAAADMAHQAQPARLIVLGQQEGAYWALHWATNQEPAAAPDALILLHPQAAEPFPTLDDLTGRLSLPVADYHFAHNQAAAQAARQRLNSSRRNPRSQYLQTALQEPAAALQENELLRRVKGWLASSVLN